MKFKPTHKVNWRKILVMQRALLEIQVDWRRLICNTNKKQLANEIETSRN